MNLDQILEGAIDLHVHGFPEIADDVRPRFDDAQLAQQCLEGRMQGFVLKSHLWPTVGRVNHLRKQFPSLDIIASITLNQTTGGLCPLSVESAARQGARVIYMPTWSASNDKLNRGFNEYMKRYFPTLHKIIDQSPISLFTPNGTVRPEVLWILEIARAHNLVIATGHINPTESLLLTEEAIRVGAGPVIFSHPYTRSVGASLDQMKAMAQKGAYVEICCLSTLPPFQSLQPKYALEIINEVGIDRCILTTDFFFEWAPAPHDMMRMVLGALISQGLSKDNARRLVHANPRRIMEL